MFNLNDFIDQYVTHRTTSMFRDDIADNMDNLYAAIERRTVLVIGGAGSIGSSFIKAILPFHLSELYIVDTNENALTELTRSLRSSNEYSKLIPDIYLSYPMDYNSVTFKRLFNAHKGFDIVANFSAHKHVRSEKDIYSIEALIRNNVINAKNLLELLAAYPPKSYFCVSTDKAANPVNIMGASKRIMEDLIFSYSDVFPVKTARFANVAFSNGSLPAGFLQRMEQLQPLSAPSDVKRYFVSPTESGQICMLSAFLGENRAIFFPKLEDETMRSFDDIARDLLLVNGYDPLECESDEEAIKFSAYLKEGSKKYPVHFSISDTSGEKVFEEFFTITESVDMRHFKSLGVITDKPAPDKKGVQEIIDELDRSFERECCKKEDIVNVISAYLPSFKHIETGKGLDGKM